MISRHETSKVVPHDRADDVSSYKEGCTMLASYLRGTYKEDKKLLNQLLAIIAESLPIFWKCSHKMDVSLKDTETESGTVESVHVKKTWFYAVPSENENTFSFSTHGMILFALDAFGQHEKDNHSVLLAERFKAPKLSDLGLNKEDRGTLGSLIAKAKKGLVEVIKGKKQNAKQPLVTSGTYGHNDPLTLTWLSELVRRCRARENEIPKNDLEACITKICAAAEQALFDRGDKILDLPGSNFKELTSSFLKLRQVHLARSVERLGSVKAKGWEYDWHDFENTIHRELSHAAIGDSRFDPAELAFALEGALQVDPLCIGRATVDHVFEALKTSDERHPYWRPTTPFLVNDRGSVLFPISVEIANSILRSCEILDRDEVEPRRFSQFEHQLRQFAAWLASRKERVKVQTETSEIEVVGWHSEHVNMPGTIHLWETSQVVLFLSHYASLLKRKIAADGIEAAGIKLQLPQTIKLYEKYFEDEPLKSMADGSKYAVLKQIEEQFISQRKNGEEDVKPGVSMLLYGPPGTGKTTLAKQMAKRLDRPLIVITVSDFLEAGPAEIEARAKGVFEVLRSQEHVVILFDEIDQFLLDRNSEAYQRQSDVFKFMTPGMLTKLQNLRDSEDCIFIIATNYFERIDSAIKRRGRIDEHYLLSIPDKVLRMELLKRFVLELFENKLKKNVAKQEFKIAATTEDSRTFFEDVSAGEFRGTYFEDAIAEEGILEKTVLYGWGDLKNLIESKTKTEKGMDVNKLASEIGKATAQVDSAVELSAYRSRFETKDESPFEEFFLLVYLYAESDKELSKADENTIQAALKKIDALGGRDLCTFLEEESIQDPVVLEKLKHYHSLEQVIDKWVMLKVAEQLKKVHAAQNTSNG